MQIAYKFGMGEKFWDTLKKELIIQVLQKTEGNKTRAAEMRGITRRRLYSMMERFGVPEF